MVGRYVVEHVLDVTDRVDDELTHVPVLDAVEHRRAAMHALECAVRGIADTSPPTCAHHVSDRRERGGRRPGSLSDVRVCRREMDRSTCGPVVSDAGRGRRGGVGVAAGRRVAAVQG